MKLRSGGQLLKVFGGKRVAWTVAPGVEVAAIVNDVAVNYGRETLLIRPVCGNGATKWVNARNVRIVPDDWGGPCT